MIDIANLEVHFIFVRSLYISVLIYYLYIKTVNGKLLMYLVSHSFIFEIKIEVFI